MSLGDHKKSNTWDKIKDRITPKQSMGDEELALQMLGVDKSLLGDLERELVDAAKEELKPKIKYVNTSTNPDLEYKYLDDSGFDLRADLDKPMTLKSLDRALVPTGLSFELPESYEIQVRPRSGLASKNGITVLNTPGTVDRGYNGEIKVILINLSKESFTINHGDRIAQAVVSPVISGRWCNLIKTNMLDETSRGDGGFGSTGIN